VNSWNPRRLNQPLQLKSTRDLVKLKTSCEFQEAHAGSGLELHASSREREVEAEEEQGGKGTAASDSPCARSPPTRLTAISRPPMAPSAPNASSAAAKAISLTGAPRGPPMAPPTRSSSSEMEKAWSTYAMPGANPNPRPGEKVPDLPLLLERFGDGWGRAAGWGGWEINAGEIGKRRTRREEGKGREGRAATLFFFFFWGRWEEEVSLDRASSGSLYATQFRCCGSRVRWVWWTRTAHRGPRRSLGQPRLNRIDGRAIVGCVGQAWVLSKRLVMGFGSRSSGRLVGSDDQTIWLICFWALVSPSSGCSTVHHMCERASKCLFRWGLFTWWNF